MHDNRQGAWKQFWDETGQSGDPLAAIDLPEVSRHTYDIVCTRIRQLLQLSADDRVLNIGCGPGLFEEQLARSVQFTIGLDFSYIMVDKACRRNRTRDNTAFLQATGTALPFAQPLFNKVLCYSILHYFSEDEVILLLHELRRVTVIGSLVLLGDVENEAKGNTPTSLGRAWEIWCGAGGRVAILRGAQRIRSEIGRRVKRLQRAWMVLTRRYIAETKPAQLSRYTPDRMLSLAAAAGFHAEIIEQNDERFVTGRYHVLLQSQ